ncbi:hypothetical protein ABID08_005301 [Rhizobium binae]|uniref:Uncharacterized protein n=1 Tax=Rhizobium binae TaxID=1138190 RepID=A0ABV2MN80_9HYPH
MRMARSSSATRTCFNRVPFKLIYAGNSRLLVCIRSFPMKSPVPCTLEKRPKVRDLVKDTIGRKYSASGASVRNKLLGPPTHARPFVEECATMTTRPDRPGVGLKA